MPTATDIYVHFGQARILQEVTFTASPGELTAIVGPNGSGKTTLLRAMTGEVAYDGQVSLNGRNIAALKPYQLAAMRGVLAQATPLAFPFTVIEVVRLGLEAGLSAGRERLPHMALERVGLAGYEGRFYQQLSGGEKQRVQLARVLAQIWEPMQDGAPRWLFLDEPVSALDIGHQLTVMQLARDYADAGGGVVAVMHDLNLTAMFSDRVSLMNRGQIAASGAVDDVLTDENLSHAYGVSVHTSVPPPLGGVYVLPQAATSPSGAPLSPYDRPKDWR
jgi:iron complex transport system ATP-binding protein